MKPRLRKIFKSLLSVVPVMALVVLTIVPAWCLSPVPGISLGSSTPSDADYSGQKTMTNRGYKGNTFVIGVRSSTVTFFNKDGALTTVKWADFLRMGGQKV